MKKSGDSDSKTASTTSTTSTTVGRRISRGLRWDVFARDQYTCRYCGQTPPGVVLEIEHVIPVSRGGTNDIDNLVAACRECNQGKGTREAVLPISAPPPRGLRGRWAIHNEHLALLEIVDRADDDHWLVRIGDLDETLEVVPHKELIDRALFSLYDTRKEAIAEIRYGRFSGHPLSIASRWSWAGRELQ